MFLDILTFVGFVFLSAGVVDQIRKVWHKRDVSLISITDISARLFVSATMLVKFFIIKEDWLTLGQIIMFSAITFYFCQVVIKKLKFKRSFSK